MFSNNVEFNFGSYLNIHLKSVIVHARPNIARILNLIMCIETTLCGPYKLHSLMKYYQVRYCYNLVKITSIIFIEILKLLAIVSINFMLS